MLIPVGIQHAAGSELQKVLAMWSLTFGASHGGRQKIKKSILKIYTYKCYK